MSKVGAFAKKVWLEEPFCQNCHTGTAVKNNGRIRHDNAFDSNQNLRKAVDQAVATNADVSAKGLDLYRFSRSHKGIQCEACHGSTHAVLPSMHATGTVGHDKHGRVAEKQCVQTCKACHGTVFRGTVLSRSFSVQTLSSSKTFFRGAIVSCHACHLVPNSDKVNPNGPAMASEGKIMVGDKPVAITLLATDPDKNPLNFRIVSQPAHGRVALTANRAIYYPDGAFAGFDSLSFSAYDRAIDSNLAKVTVTRLADSREYGRGYPGKGGSIPRLRAGGMARLGIAVDARPGQYLGQRIRIRHAAFGGASRHLYAFRRTDPRAASGYNPACATRGAEQARMADTQSAFTPGIRTPAPGCPIRSVRPIPLLVHAWPGVEDGEIDQRHRGHRSVSASARLLGCRGWAAHGFLQARLDFLLPTEQLGESWDIGSSF